MSKRGIFYLTLLIPIVGFAVFLHLDSAPFRQWDESYLATHTRLMMTDHDFIVTHNDMGPEMSNTKPPFAVWCMVAASALVGYGELAIRLPNAIAGLLVCFALFFFVMRRCHSPEAGFAVVMVLVSSLAFVRHHVIRTGEYDGLLLLFILIFSLAYYLILETHCAGRRRSIFWAVFTVSTILAIWTKGIQPMIMMPALLLYTLLTRKLKFILATKDFYLSAASIIFFGLGYYLLREHYNPGYMQAVWENELGGRYAAANEGHRGTFTHYIRDIAQLESNWLPLFIVGVCCAFITREKRIRGVLLFSITLFVSYLLIISAGATKLYWYEGPALPFFAMIAGLGMWSIIDHISGNIRGNAPKVAASTLLMLLFSLQGYMQVIRQDQIVPAEDYDDSLVQYLKEAMKKDLPQHAIVVYKSDGLYDNVLRCELFKANKKGLDLRWQFDPLGLHPGNVVITSNPSTRYNISQAFDYEIYRKEGNVEVWRLKACEVRP